MRSANGCFASAAFGGSELNENQPQTESTGDTPMKQTVSILSVLLLLAAPVATADQDGPYTYTVTNGQATITAFNTSYSGPLSITNTLGGHPVTAIRPRAFLGCRHLTSVTIPDSIANIGEWAFSYCSILDNVTISAGVADIGNSAFESCHSLTSVVIPNSVTSLGVQVFHDCYNLTRVTIPDGIANIAKSAFFGCHSLTNVTIPSSVTNIGDGAFHDCYSLTSVTIPSSVASIQDYGFLWCTNLARVYFRGNAPWTGSYVFYDVPATIYYLPDTTGWGATFAGRPAVLWNPFFSGMAYDTGLRQCTLTITGTPHIPIAIETCTNLLAPVWVPLLTTNLGGGLFDFRDFDSTKCPSRSYRIGAP